MPDDDVRPCERHCPKCDQWKHHSRFHSRKRKRARSRDLAVHFDTTCKDCQQIERNERKNADPAAWIMGRRIARHARLQGCTPEFLRVNMNWQALIPELRALLLPGAVCPCCGHPFKGESDIQIEHHFPPRWPKGDWARQHKRNLSLACGSCNDTKTDKAYDVWLDEQEDCRLANEAHRAATDAPPPPESKQLTLGRPGRPVTAQPQRPAAWRAT